MTCEIKVLISIRSPTLAASGSFTRGLFMAKSLGLAAATPDRDLHGAAADQEPAIAELGQRDHLLGLGQTHAACRRGLARQGAKAEGGDARLRVFGRHDVDGLDVVVGSHRAFYGNRQRHGIAVLGDLRQLQRHLALDGLGIADEALQGLLPGWLAALGGKRAPRPGRDQQCTGGKRKFAATEHGGGFCLYHLKSGQTCAKPPNAGLPASAPNIKPPPALPRAGNRQRARLFSTPASCRQPRAGPSCPAQGSRPYRQRCRLARREVPPKQAGLALRRKAAATVPLRPPNLQPYSRPSALSPCFVSRGGVGGWPRGQWQGGHWPGGL